MATITIPKKLIRNNNLTVIEKRKLEEMTKENMELKMAIKAILSGESALRQGKTRSLSNFLKVKSPKYAKNR